MLNSPVFTSTRPIQADSRPHLISYDSGPECSIEHWKEISWFVQHEDDELEGYLFTDDSEVRHALTH